jgi:glyoxylase-like metal-dependent hydrolase (beta-lactamase superfamily II)
MPSEPRVACFLEPQFGENAYVAWTRDAGPCWIVDPGLPPSARQIVEHVRRNGLKPEAIVLTHAHADHIAGIPEVLASFPALPVYLADEEARSLIDGNENLSAAFGAPITVDAAERRGLPPGAVLTLDDTHWHVLDTSGHSPGGRSLYCQAAGVVIVGDALFADGIGRYDFHHSDGPTLLRNIREKLLSLPDETVMYSGHGPRSTIGRVKKYNPFVPEILAFDA